MDNAISEYQKWKQQGLALRTQARQAMESRFHDLLTEAARIAQEYHADFGSALKPPAIVNAFRYKPSGRKGGKGAQAAKAPAATQAPPKVEKSDPRIKALEKRLAQARAKVDVAKAAGKPTRNLEDRVYEIEDELRLAAQNG
jgi:small-conductance mechanosensitive channel